MYPLNPLIHLSTKKLKYTGRRNKPEPCKKFRKVSHCIFDLDGTILDNQRDLDKAYKYVFDRYGQVYTPEWRLKLMGMTGKAMWLRVIQELRLKADWHNLYEEYSDAVKELQSKAPLRPGIERLLNHLDKYCIPMAIATSSRKASMEAKTSHIPHIMSMFSHVVCGGDDPHVTHSKPHAEIYAICAIRFLGKPEPDSCLVFEDSPIGVMAALNACMQVVGVPCPPTPLMALRDANEVLKSLLDFWPGKYGMPPFPEQKNASPPN